MNVFLNLISHHPDGNERRFFNMQSRGLPMKRYLISIFLALAVQICYANEWKWKADTGNDGVVLIGASREGFETFSEAVDSVEKELWIQYIRLSTLFHHPQLQNEIHEYMKRNYCLLYTSPSPRDRTRSRMPSSA